MRRSFLLLALLVLTLSAAGCDDNPAGSEDDPVLETQTIEDLPADPAVNTGGGRPQGTGRFALFSLRDGEVVLSSSNTNRADSASTQWDIGLRGLDIITNGGVSGPGEATGYIAERAFGEVTEVNTDRLQADTESSMRLRDWYNYNANGQHVVRPLPGRTLIARTADGEHYAKIRILSYYEGSPDNPASSEASSRYYTFEYVLSDEPSFE